ncbi:prepilin peptidase [Erwinia psidii]|uniref:Prepilin leader peptidase/N-methyltransferase n=2 Tax=Erwinia psidii TaxID=69224 RepID=A0A3N6SF93_9GAMM|nr:prepilin peptidase [Erwinia psidii]MCX8960796.1 prepilin peptidase [Erwinia psidii]MCX8964964.1 prepilin peptidase [Erwinia psidii]RQM38563.1 prepilin peptidase [Erwinia psidii]
MWWVITGGLGLIAGSVLNCVAWRLPQMLQRQALAEARHLLALPSEHGTECVNLFSPRSCCPYCRRRLAFYHNVPLLSWLYLRGRCHYCQHHIGWRYPLTELAAAVSSFWVAFNWPPDIAAFALIFCGWLLILLAVIDIEYMLLPDRLTLLLLWLGLLANLNGSVVLLNDAVIGALLGYLSLWAIHWIFKIVTGKEGLGYGDFKLLAALGAWCGWRSLPLLVLYAALMASAVHLLLHFMGRRSLNEALPFGPWLALSGWWLLMMQMTSG